MAESENGDHVVPPEQQSKLDQRDHLVAGIEAIMSLVGDTETSVHGWEIKLMLLEEHYRDLKAVQSSIEEFSGNVWDATLRSNYEDTYVTAKEIIMSKLASLRTPEPDPMLSSTRFPNSSSFLSSNRRPKLPSLQLTQFNGSHSDWLDFSNVFNALVDNNNELSNTEKFQYLRSCLTGNAARLVQSLEVTEDNYNRACELLSTRYENKRYILQSHLQHVFDIQKVTQPRVSTLREFIDSVSVNLRAMQSIASPEQIAKGILLHLVTSKLDPETQAKWEEEVSASFDTKSTSSTLNLPSWENLSQFWEIRCKTLNMIEASQARPNTNKSSNSSRKSSSLVATSSQKCELCQTSPRHSAFKCSKFIGMKHLQRYSLVRQNGLCLNCLGAGHMAKDCPSTSKCQTCGSSHHTLLHREKGPQQDQTPVDEPGRATSSSSTALQVSYSNCDVLLATALIIVSNSHGTSLRARALLDSASQLNFVTEKLAQHLRVGRQRGIFEVTGIGSNTTKTQQMCRFDLSSIDKQFSTIIDAIIMGSITTSQPNSFIDTTTWGIPQNINLADETFAVPGQIDVLLGAGLFFDLLGRDRIKLHGPILQNTTLGWIVAGVLPTKSLSAVAVAADRGSTISTQTSSRSSTQLHKVFVTTCSQQSPDLLLERFWSIEETSTQNPPLSIEETECEAHFAETYKRCPLSGKFIVRLPMKTHASTLGQSYAIARQRFRSLERKLNTNMDLRHEYSSFINECIELGHMSVVTDEELVRGGINYIPHHCVTKADSSTTKLRVVFDASCRTSNGICLNDIVKVGPTLQDDIFTILQRLRRHRYVIMADIAKMYRQVIVDKRDTHLQCIMWRSSPEENIRTYRLNTVTYGTSCAPYLAIKSLRQLAVLEAKNFPIGSAVALQDFYVDNLLSGASTKDEVIEIKRQVTEMLKRGGFPLRKFASNDCSIVNDIKAEDLEESVAFNDTSYIKALGVKWLPKEDAFMFAYSTQGSSPSSSALTKRSILSHICGIFDPLGLLNPLIVTCKILMQSLWKLTLHWDDAVPASIERQWVEIQEQLARVQQIEIPRFVPFNSTTQIHIFADASTKAFGACAYAVTQVDDVIVSSLLCAKSRVAPTKSVTLPRLELCAAVLASKLARTLANIFETSAVNLFCWSDSTITLAWIANEPSRWNVFVANRVNEIQQNTAGCTWSHVPTNHNPADLVSRGATSAELINNSLWFQGPEFLRQGKHSWPSPPDVTNENLPEQRRKTVLAATATQDIIRIQKYVNNYSKLLRIFAYVNRFCARARKREQVLPSLAITTSELKGSLHLICRCIQQSTFIEEYALLQQNRSISRRSSLLQLTPFCHDNLIRVDGRLSNSSLTFDSKHPIVLPHSHPFVEALIKHFHREHLHAGAQTLHNILRQTFWIVNGRNVIKKVNRQCITCVRCRPVVAEQLLGNLPASRVEMAAPFERCGVDFCGPLQYTQKIRNRAPIKIYLAIFVCFASKGVHLELVPDLTTAAFIAALRRFIARRGKCRIIYSDNATNFVGANRELREMLQEFISQEHIGKVQQVCSEEGIEWKFIPPRSPHFGGLWEGAVKQAKYYLRRTIGSHILSFDELHTLCCQVEAMVNSRPLSAMSSDPNDLQPLTPAHLIVGRPLHSVPESSHHNIDSLRRYQLVQGMQQQFWRRWHQEYLHELQQRHKWALPRTNLQVNDLVIIKEENTPPFKWPMGRIVETIKGSDGHTRVVVVKVKDGLQKRAIARVCRLPIQTSDSSAPPSSSASQVPPQSS